MANYLRNLINKIGENFKINYSEEDIQEKLYEEIDKKDDRDYEKLLLERREKQVQKVEKNNYPISADQVFKKYDIFSSYNGIQVTQMGPQIMQMSIS